MYKELEKLYNDLLEDIKCTKQDIKNAYGDDVYECAANSRLNVLMQYTSRIQIILNHNIVEGFENAPVIHNESVIGIVKSKSESTTECVLWDRFIGIDTINGMCSSVVIK